jgi:hypothetical protein
MLGDTNANHDDSYNLADHVGEVNRDVDWRGACATRLRPTQFVSAIDAIAKPDQTPPMVAPPALALQQTQHCTEDGRVALPGR